MKHIQPFLKNLRFLNELINFRMLYLGFVVVFTSIAITGCMTPDKYRMIVPTDTKNRRPPSSEPTRQKIISTDGSQIISTSKGQFKVPGIAYLDGRDFEATPPLTLMKMNVWSGVPRSKINCQLPHGEKVDLLEVDYYDSETRNYFYIQGNKCSGWIPDVFLSPKYEESVGDLIP